MSLGTQGNDPVYPIKNEGGYDKIGLTKREVFAMVALNGLLASGGHWTSSQRVQISVEQADELIKALNQIK